jgi:hypothetical protein
MAQFLGSRGGATPVDKKIVDEHKQNAIKLRELAIQHGMQDQWKTLTEGIAVSSQFGRNQVNTMSQQMSQVTETAEQMQRRMEGMQAFHMWQSANQEMDEPEEQQQQQQRQVEEKRPSVAQPMEVEHRQPIGNQRYSDVYQFAEKVGGPARQWAHQHLETFRSTGFREQDHVGYWKELAKHDPDTTFDRRIVTLGPASLV